MCDWRFAGEDIEYVRSGMDIVLLPGELSRQHNVLRLAGEQYYKYGILDLVPPYPEHAAVRQSAVCSYLTTVMVGHSPLLVESS